MEAVDWKSWTWTVLCSWLGLIVWIYLLGNTEKWGQMQEALSLRGPTHVELNVTEHGWLPGLFASGVAWCLPSLILPWWPWSWAGAEGNVWVSGVFSYGLEISVYINWSSFFCLCSLLTSRNFYKTVT